MKLLFSFSILVLIIFPVVMIWAVHLPIWGAFLMEFMVSVILSALADAVWDIFIKPWLEDEKGEST